MARRRRKSEEHVNHEAWAIPYGDLITLLLAFFVVMYALSSVNEGKFRVLAESLQSAFRGAPMAPEPIQVGQPARGLDPSVLSQPLGVSPPGLAATRSLAEHFGDRDGGPLDGASAVADDDALALQEIERGLQEMADQIQRAMTPLIEEDLIRLRRERFWVEVEINTSLLFASGSAQIFAEARPILEELAGILQDLPVRVHVEGFTDDLPISTPAFPSNWELSAGRASSVLRLLADRGLDPTRMAAVGFGEHRPIADNATPEGRQQNRRVVIVVLADEPPRVHQTSSPETLHQDLDRGSAPSGASGRGEP
ncbi:MAG: flagellar motor protein MotD [Thioalkalivibrio sp.]|nr:MAG: flagellar motor protein MotD [Thioalkalivibrio sp.]